MVDAGEIKTGSTVATYEYDGLGRRIVRAIDNSGDLDATYDDYYDGQRCVEVRDGSDDVLKQRVWGLEYIDELVQVAINDDPTDGTEDDVETYYYTMCNANYNVQLLIDDEGVIVERYEYAPYGERTVYISPGTNDPDCHAPTLLPTRVDISGDQPYGICEIGHQGKQHSEVASGIIWHGQRPWHTRFAKFIVRDYLGYPDGANAYAGYHVMHGGLDPSGLELLDRQAPGDGGSPNRQNHGILATAVMSNHIMWRRNPSSQTCYVTSLYTIFYLAGNEQLWSEHEIAGVRFRSGTIEFLGSSVHRAIINTLKAEFPDKWPSRQEIANALRSSPTLKPYLINDVINHNSDAILQYELRRRARLLGTQHRQQPKPKSGFSGLREYLERQAEQDKKTLERLRLMQQQAEDYALEAILGLALGGRKPSNSTKPTTRADLHIDLRNKGFEYKSTSKGGYVTYKHPDGRVVTIKPSGEVIPTKPATSSGGKRYNERTDYDFNRLPNQSHSTDHFVEPL